MERRRRDNINEKISELATLIPESLLLEGSGAGGTATTPSASGGPSAAGGGPLASSTGNLNNNPGSPTNASGGGVGDDGVSIKSEILQESLQLGTGELAIPPAVPHGIAVTDEDGGVGAALKANKGVILRKSVDYIRCVFEVVFPLGSTDCAVYDDLTDSCLLYSDE